MHVVSLRLRGCSNKHQYWAYDTAQFQVLQQDVFASEIEVDFVALFGGEVQNYSNEEMVQSWKKLRKYSVVVQHVVTLVFSLITLSSPVKQALKLTSYYRGVLPFFPSPNGPDNASKETPSRVEVFANVNTYLRRDVQPGQSMEAQYDATINAEVIRLPGALTTGNPWRVSKLKGNTVRQKNIPEYWSDL